MKKTAVRIILYALGMLILAAGITLNTKATLGVSPIISVAYAVSEITGVSFGDATFVWYGVFVAAEIVIHLIMGRKKGILGDVLQLPVSFVFTRVMNLLSAAIPVFETAYTGTFFGGIVFRLIILAVAIVFTGVGAALSLEMRIVPNPGEGIVQALADIFGANTGTVKNIFDISCVALTAILSLIFTQSIIGIGIGTLAAALGVGRVIALFIKLCGTRLREEYVGAEEK